MSAEVFLDGERPMEDAENVDGSVRLHQVGDAVVAVQQDVNLSIIAVPLTDLGECQ